MPTRAQIQAEITAERLRVGEEVLAMADKLSGFKAIGLGLMIIAAIAGLILACGLTAGLACAVAILALIAWALGMFDGYFEDDSEADELEIKQARIKELVSQLADA